MTTRRFGPLAGLRWGPAAMGASLIESGPAGDQPDAPAAGAA